MSTINMNLSRQKALLFEIISVLNQKKNSLFREFLEHFSKVLHMRVQKQYYSTRISGLDHGITERVWS